MKINKIKIFILINQKTVYFRPAVITIYSIACTYFILFRNVLTVRIQARCWRKKNKKKKALGAFPANDFAYPCSSAIYAFLSPSTLPLVSQAALGVPKFPEPLMSYPPLFSLPTIRGVFWGDKTPACCRGKGVSS